MKVAVVGLGKIGLPLAVQFAIQGHEVVGIDINSRTIELVNQGLEPFPEEKDLGVLLSEVVQNHRLYATNSYNEGISSANVVVAVVPVLVNEKSQPDFAIIDQVSKEIGVYLSRGTLVCYETTLPVGTTRTRLVPMLEKYSKLTAGVDFHVVFSPERVLTGRIFEDLRKYPKIVGGYTKECSRLGRRFYESALTFDPRSDLERSNGVWEVMNCDASEFVKLAETTYRDVNIGLANEFMTYAETMGLDIYEVIESANSQVFSHIHQPGISVGGHCIPVYPHFYLHGNPGADVVRAARTLNESIPEFVVQTLIKSVGDITDLNILVLGVSYRPKVKEHAFSGAFALRQSLTRHGAKSFFIDPYYSDKEICDIGLTPWDFHFDSIDAIILHTAHEQFISFIASKFDRCKLIIDGRNFLKSETVPSLLKVIGKPLTFETPS